MKPRTPPMFGHRFGRIPEKLDIPPSGTPPTLAPMPEDLDSLMDRVESYHRDLDLEEGESAILQKP